MTVHLTSISEIEYINRELASAIDKAIITKAQEKGLDFISAEIVKVADDQSWADVDLYKKWEGCFETIKVYA